ncbi:response regulator, partial [Elusimicrobiota bacterium]
LGRVRNREGYNFLLFITKKRKGSLITMEERITNILLVEDNPDHEELIVKEIKNNRIGNKVYVARDGQEALDFLYHQGKYENPKDSPTPEIILLDLKLPKVEGTEVLKRIKSDSTLKVIPVVILTTSSRDEDIAKSYKNGTNSYITKPVKFEEFTKVIKDINLYWMQTNKGIKQQKENRP